MNRTTETMNCQIKTDKAKEFLFHSCDCNLESFIYLKISTNIIGYKLLSYIFDDSLL